MMKKIFQLRELYLTVLFFAAVILLMVGMPHFKSVQLTQRGITSAKSLPISEPMEIGESFSVEFQLASSFFNGYKLKINPDDCMDSLYLNGNAVRVDTIEGHCDWNHGFILSAADLHTVKMVLHNGGGPGGIQTTLSSSSLCETIIFWIAILSLCADLFFILRRFHIRGTILLIFLLGVLFRLLYASITDTRDRTYDIDGHMEYIAYISEEGKIPDNEACWSCYHPPLYYAIMVPPWDAAGFFDLSKPRCAQWMSVFFSLLTFGCGLLCLRYYVKGGAFVVAGFLWAFWPGVIMASPRIGNDILFALAHVLCLWSCLRYLTRQNGRDLIFAAVFCWGAYFSKATGTVTIALWLATCLMGYFPREHWRPTGKECVGLGLFVLLLASIFYQRLSGVPLVGNLQSLNSGLKVGNAPGNYLFFDLRDYLTNPYTSGWDDAGGREYFWNYLLKSSLFGEFRLLTTPLGNALAMCLNVCVLGFMGFALVGLWKIKITRVNLLLILQAVLFVVALAVLRMNAPYACSNDFRYIVPVMLSFAPFVGMGIFADKASTKIKIVGVSLVVIFTVCSVVMLLSL